MKELLNILLEFVIAYVLVFILYYLLFVRKKTRYNKNRVPVEFYYLVSLYRLDQKKINYNFMSESFINEVIKYLTTNKLEKIS